MNAFRLLGLCCLAALVFTGCAGMGSGSSDVPFDKMITKDTSLYRSGTLDSVTIRPLEAGVRLRVIGLSGEGLVEIETASGEKGFVPRECIGEQPLPPPN